MRCSSVRKRIQFLVTGELDKTTAAQVTEHIELCAECASEKVAYERLMIDLSTPRPMATLPAGLETLHVVDKQSRRVPVLSFMIASLGAVAIAMVMLFVNTQKQPVQPCVTPPLSRQRVAQVKTPVIAPKPAPVHSPVRQVRHRIVMVRKRVAHPRVMVRRYTSPHTSVKQLQEPTRQASPAAPPAVNHSELDVQTMAQVPQLPPVIDIEITDYATGRVDVERHIGNGPVCSLSIE
ncbi:MAG: zf-HC2 domain-containing protein [Armatimonadota bacterium]|nr:zf-HC2 domain-containing protein [bacterium]